MEVQKIKEWIYSQLSDEESKFIYSEKLKFNETGNTKHIDNIIERYLPEIGERLSIWDVVVNRKNENKKLVIWGAGYQGRSVWNICKIVGLKVEFFCDNAMEKQGTFIDDIPVFSIEELLKQEDLDKISIIVSPEFVDVEIKEELLARGIKEENIFLYNKLRMLTEEQYFDEAIIALNDNEVFVDGGCYDFGTGEQFLKRMGNKKCKIFSFEPDLDNLQVCKKAIRELHAENVELINAGLWDKNTYLEFKADGSSSRIIESDDEEGNKVKVIALDSFIEEKVTFIKLDVEGAELKTLQGAEKIILRDKPKLAVCLYHKKEDMWEIPYYIKQLVPEYKLYVRHYSNSDIETVLYAVI